MPWMDYQVLSDKTNYWLKIVEESNPEKIKFQLNTEDLMRNPQAWYSLLPDLYDHQGELMYQQTQLNDKKISGRKQTLVLTLVG
ncbi:Uncharacterised protein [Neisseria zoodegmatis]|nr:Uncharacterised protein [Neisseria zoodegmatis]